MGKIIETYYMQAVSGLGESILNDREAWHEHVLQLPQKQQVVYTVVLFHSQVENGGFHQYYFNAYGQFVYLTIENLQIIGALKRRNLLEKSLATVNDTKVEEATFRALVYNRAIERISEFDEQLTILLDAIDEEYANIEDEPIDILLEKYLIDWQQ